MSGAMLHPEVNLWRRLFFPHAYREIEQLRSNNGRLVHYTSLEVACSIFRHKELWMRNAAVMNDSSEMRWGDDCLTKALSSGAGKRFRSILDALHPQSFDCVAERFEVWKPDVLAKTYIACLSIHNDDEDQWGRLSMWRAYGNVAIILNNDAFLNSGSAFMPTSSPVAYFTVDQTIEHLDSIAADIEANRQYVAKLGRHHLEETLFNLMRYAVLANKHPGFREEREWRLMFTEGPDQPDFLKRELKVVNDIPQSVYKLPLIDSPIHSVVGNNLVDHVNRVIIGPCNHPETARLAVIEHLEKAGIADASSRVVISNLPLRY